MRAYSKRTMFVLALCWVLGMVGLFVRWYKVEAQTSVQTEFQVERIGESSYPAVYVIHDMKYHLDYIVVATDRGVALTRRQGQ